MVHQDYTGSNDILYHTEEEIFYLAIKGILSMRSEVMKTRENKDGKNDVQSRQARVNRGQ